MVHVNLERVLARKDVLRAIAELSRGLDFDLGLADAEGQSLWGSRATTMGQYPIELSGEVIGWVIGPERAACIPPLIACLVRQEAEKEKLRQTLQDLQLTQAQLVQSEKMSSLGQLVAGMAHEINNPVNFIYGNLRFATDYVQDLMQLLQHYQETIPIAPPELQAEIESIDLQFLMEDLPSLLSSMRVGADRILDIVRSLKNFSRHDEADRKVVDLHEGLDSTLMILHNRIKATGDRPAIQVLQEYGNLPPIECYPGQLNQVFMNILSNAIDALEEVLVTSPQSSIIRGRSQAPVPASEIIPTITIRTKVLNREWVSIQIIDNGPGMPEDVLQRIYDPFFTTKEVGQGTGLGMSISHQIVVEKHGGVLKCHSQVGAGTEFEIQIPVCRIPTAPDQSSPTTGAIQKLPDNAAIVPPISGDTPALQPADLLARHKQLIKRLSRYSSNASNIPPERLYQMFQSNPILLKLYLALLN
ncbi:hypothetical protein BST81_18750 [Leptolyngbya sp. 'hensonii']|uniref:sensor histidine kinase n=1 Tax=Leptolyngbya sp. 'hensonii' TaxID=1922337 RepID=UPI00094FF48D|nr:ATP-binding protein [Leptolyngbya sp. 'hensonii']OLP17016.1 hypothetical protein BST81_18750 [Leptolyngbya sp. 'hensonii']